MSADCIFPRIGSIIEVDDPYQWSDMGGQTKGKRTYRVQSYMKDAPEPKFDLDTEEGWDAFIDAEISGQEVLGGILDSGNRRFKNGKRKMWCSRDEAQYVSATGVSGGMFSLDQFKVIGMVEWSEEMIAEEEEQAKRLIGEILF